MHHADLNVAVVNPSVQNHVYAPLRVVACYNFQMTQRLAASYNHSCTAILGFFFLAFAFFCVCESLYKKLNPVI